MKKLIPLLSAIALALIVVPVLMYFGDSIDKSRMRTLMLAGTVLWFISAPLWMDKRDN